MYYRERNFEFEDFFLSINVDETKIAHVLNKDGATHFATDLPVELVSICEVMKIFSTIQELIGDEVFGVLLISDSEPPPIYFSQLQTMLLVTANSIEVQTKFLQTWSEVDWLDKIEFIDKLSIDCCRVKFDTANFGLKCKVDELGLKNLNVKLLKISGQIVSFFPVGKFDTLDIENIQFLGLIGDMRAFREICNAESLFGVSMFNTKQMRINILADCPNLNFLRILETKQFNIGKSMNISFPKLRQLIFMNSKQILLHILEGAPNLELVDVSGRNAVNELEKIIFLPKLKDCVIVTSSQKDQKYIKKLLATQRPDVNINQNQFQPFPTLRPIKK
jgi:hypothetical protein